MHWKESGTVHSVGKEARRETKCKPIFTSLDGRKQLSAAKQGYHRQVLRGDIKSILRKAIFIVLPS